MQARWIFLLVSLVALSGCDDAVAPPRDLTPPAAPRGVRSVTGDHSVEVIWLANTESDVAGYFIYKAPCNSGSGCPYTRVGATSATKFIVTGLTNGVTSYYAVAAYDAAGNEGELSYATVFDTPRPAGTGAVVVNYQDSPSSAGWDFSAQQVSPKGDVATDMFYGDNGSFDEMFVPAQGDIQDAGYADDQTGLDAVDFAPNAGWSPTGSVELIRGHCYVVWTADNHFAKFRVTDFLTPTGGPRSVKFDWAYQVAQGNVELKARPARVRNVGQPTAAIR